MLKRPNLCVLILMGLAAALGFSLAIAEVGPGLASRRAPTYTSQNLRDPFESPFEIKREAYESKAEPEVSPIRSELPNLEVQGMIWGSKTPQAIINDTVVRVDEVIADATILDIRKEGIYVLYEGRQYILRPAVAK